MLTRFIVAFTLPAAAQLWATAAHAQGSGVLLGLAGRRTLWIAPDSAGAVRILENDSLLIVPRRDGFWQIAVTATDTPPDSAASGAPTAEVDSTLHACDEEEYDCGDWFARALWTAPLGRSAPRLTYPRTVDELRGFRAYGGGWRSIDVSFASPDYVSIDEEFTTGGAILNSASIGTIGSLDALAREPYADIRQELGGDPIRIDSVTMTRIERECLRQYRADADVGLDSAELFDWLEHYWLIDRRPGHWQLVWRFAKSSGAARGFVFNCDVPYALPRSVVGRDRLRPAWAEIARQVPGARDAVASPSGDLVVVLTDDRLRVFKPRGATLGPPVAELPGIHGDVVMAQWATGRHVTRWTAALAPYLAPPMPGPVDRPR